METHYKDEIKLLYNSIKVAKARLSEINTLSKTITEDEDGAMCIAEDALAEALYQLENIIGFVN